MANDPFNNKLPTIFLPLLGMVFLTVGMYIMYDNLKILEKGIPGKAKITDLVESGAGKNHVYYPVIQFTTQKGETMNVELRVGSSPPPEIGKTIDIIYQSDNPENVLEDSTFDKYGAPGIFIVLGGMSFLFGLWRRWVE